MTYKADVYWLDKERKCANIAPLNSKRNWTDYKSLYSCFPTNIMNKFGYAISFPEDISFTWNGDQFEDCVEIHSGHDFIYLDRGLGTISLLTNLLFRTDENTSLVTFPVPNEFTEGLQAFTTALSSSFFPGELQIVIKITKKDHLFTIKAGEPVASVVLMSLSQFQDTSLIMHKKAVDDNINKYWLDESYMEYSKKAIANNEGIAGFYKRAENQFGEKMGKHEILNFKFKIIDE